jgi:hypothetical protein
MRIISFDVGIKNMAFCLFDISGSRILIQDWSVLNLLNSDTMEKSICGCALAVKNKKTPAKICGRVAKFSKSSVFYCEKHAKQDSRFIIPTKETSIPSIKKLNLEQLKTLGEKYKLFDFKHTKKDIIEHLTEHFSKVTFDPIIEKKAKNAGDADLITIGKNLKKLLDENENLNSLDIVLIENQISPIANRMKTIQGMLAQYFIMKNSDIHIEFISSANKLKSFLANENLLRTSEDKSYKANKKNGVEYCSQILEKNPDFENWKPMLLTKKKDDLADSFLQGIWYIQNKMNIMRMT